MKAFLEEGGSGFLPHLAVAKSRGKDLPKSRAGLNSSQHAVLLTEQALVIDRELLPMHSEPNWSRCKLSNAPNGLNLTCRGCVVVGGIAASRALTYSNQKLICGI